MAVNLEVRNAVTAITLLTANRPLNVQFGYSNINGDGVIPKMVECVAHIMTDVNEDVENSLDTGIKLIQSSDVGSPVNNPTFTFDFSSILKPYINSGFNADFYTESTTDSVVLFNAFSGATDENNMIVVKFKATTWSEDSNGILVRDWEDDNDYVWNPEEASGGQSLSFIVGDFLLPRNHLASSQFDNVGNTPKFAIKNNSPIVSDMKFMTNIPTGYRRRIKVGYPLPINTFIKRTTSNSQLNVTGTSGASQTSFDVDITPITNSIYGKVLLNNFTPSDAYLFQEITGVSQSNINKDFSVTLNHQGVDNESLNFELTDCNEYTDNSNKDSLMIYWVNDLNALDFYMFEGGLEIKNKSSKDLYLKESRDFTKTTSSRYGVSRGITSSEYTCYSRAVNRDVSNWLSEIGRSKEVYIYDEDLRDFVPITIKESTTIPLSFNKRMAQVSISFVKETIIVN